MRITQGTFSFLPDLTDAEIDAAMAGKEPPPPPAVRHRPRN